MITFMVYGLPRPGGSKTAFINKRTGKVIFAPACKKTAQWRDSVINAAVSVYDGPPLTGPIRLDITFFLPRPKNHYGSGKNSENLKPSAPPLPITKPDRTKLLRSTEDALKHILWKDDSQVVDGTIKKEYTEGSVGALITIREVGMIRDIVAESEVGRK